MTNFLILGAVVLFFAIIMFEAFRCADVNNIPIVIGVYNREQEIEGILRNMIKKYPDTDIIAVDYGSTDETVKIIKLLQRKYPAITLVDRFHFNTLLD